MKKVVNVHIFPAQITLTTSRAQFNRLRSQHTDTPLDLDDCDGCSSEFGAHYLVGVFDGEPGTLVHELAHTAFKILRDVNVPVHHDGRQEAFCYLQQWLFDKFVVAIGSAS